MNYYSKETFFHLFCAHTLDTRFKFPNSNSEKSRVAFSMCDSSLKSSRVSFLTNRQVIATGEALQSLAPVLREVQGRSAYRISSSIPHVL